MVHENEFTEFLFFIIKRLYFFHQVTLSNWNQKEKMFFYTLLLRMISCLVQNIDFLINC